MSNDPSKLFADGFGKAKQLDDGDKKPQPPQRPRTSGRVDESGPALDIYYDGENDSSGSSDEESPGNVVPLKASAKRTYRKSKQNEEGSVVKKAALEDTAKTEQGKTTALEDTAKTEQESEQETSTDSAQPKEDPDRDPNILKGSKASEAKPAAGAK